MGKSPEARLTPEISRELCERMASKAYLSGTISNLGTQFVLGIRAVNCQTGDILAQEQATADSKEHVLSALGDASTTLRAKLGESLKTVHELATPIEQATTPSLEALQAYSIGRNNMIVKGNYAAAVPRFQRATELDPNFAMAYAMLGTAYYNVGEAELAAENAQRSFERRTKVSEREKSYIESHYHHFVTGDLEKSRQAYEMWMQTYPRDSIPPTNLGVLNQTLGRYEKALEDFRLSQRIAPNDALGYSNQLSVLVNLNRVKEADRLAEEAAAKKLDATDIKISLYQLAFLRNNDAGMTEQVKWAAERPGDEAVFLYYAADTAAYFGRLDKARELSRQAVVSAERAGHKEKAAGCEAAAALREALFGDSARAKQYATSALRGSKGKDVQFVAGLALAMLGDREKAFRVADSMKTRSPDDTILQFNYLPTIYAQIELNDRNPQRAIELLQPATRYELGLAGGTSYSTYMYPVYIRGLAYLAAKQGSKAAAEFQKILDWPGVVANEPIGPLAYLQLGRAKTMNGETTEAHAAYNAFLSLWKNADPETPILNQAKAEYAKLQ